MNSVPPSPSPKIATLGIEYRNVTFDELVSVYKGAYVKQKFHAHVIFEDVSHKGGGRYVRLILDKVNEAYPKREKARISFRFYSSSHGICSPCSVSSRP